MENITILIPHNKSPYAHDMMTVQCNNICKELQKKCNLQVVWAVFSPEKIIELKTDNLQIINSHNYKNVLEIIESIDPDLILINGTLDFHNVESAMVARFKNIPLVTIFFWGRSQIYFNISQNKITSKLKSVQARCRNLVSDRVSPKLSTPNKPIKFQALRFFIKQYSFLRKNLKAINLSTFQQIKFILSYTKTVLFSLSPVNKIISGNVNLCSVEEWIKTLSELGFDKSSIFVVGDTYFDTLYSEMQSNKTKPPTEINITRILFCTSTMYEHGLCSEKEEYDLISSVVTEILNHNEFEIAIKIHPSTASREKYEQLLRNFLGKVKIYQKENLTELISQYDVMVTYGGTSAIFYGIVQKKPIVVLNFFNTSTSCNLFQDKEVTTECNSISDLISKIKESKRRVVSEISYAKYLERHLDKFDGKNSERSASIILKLIQKKLTH